MTTTPIGKASRDPRVAAMSDVTVRRERLQRSVSVRRQAEIGKEAGHHDPLAEVAQPRLRPLASCECKRELRITTARRERQRKPAAETRVDVGEQVRAICLPEALDVRRPYQTQLLGDLARQLDQALVADRHPLDGLAAFGLDHGARDRIEAASVEIAEHVDGEL